MFDVNRINDGITAACDAVDELGLTLIERWWVFCHLELAARHILSENAEQTSREMAELKKKWEGLAEVPVKAGLGGGVGDEGDESSDGDEAEGDAEED